MWAYPRLDSPAPTSVFGRRRGGGWQSESVGNG